MVIQASVWLLGTNLQSVGQATSKGGKRCVKVDRQGSLIEDQSVKTSTQQLHVRHALLEYQAKQSAIHFLSTDKQFCYIKTRGGLA